MLAFRSAARADRARAREYRPETLAAMPFFLFFLLFRFLTNLLTAERL